VRVLGIEATVAFQDQAPAPFQDQAPAPLVVPAHLR